MLMAKSFTHISLVQVYAYQTIVSDLKTSIKKVSWSFVQRKLINEKAKILDFQVNNRLNKWGAVVLTYDLWMS